MSEAVGGLIRAARESRGMSKCDLMRASGMTPAQIGRLERGEVNPKASTIVRLAGALGVEPGTLLPAGN